MSMGAARVSHRAEAWRFEAMCAYRHRHLALVQALALALALAQALEQALVAHVHAHAHVLAQAQAQQARLEFEPSEPSKRPSSPTHFDAMFDAIERSSVLIISATEIT